MTSLSLLALALLLAPALLSAVLAGRAGVTPAAAAAWSLARTGALLSLLAALAHLLLVLLNGPTLSAWLRSDLPGALVLTLVTFIGWVIVRYSATYLDGEADTPRFARWLLATVAAVALVLAANHLALLALAWLGASLSLHRLLTWYADRHAAVVAAHKKALVARAADLAMLLALALFALSLGTLQIDELTARAAQGPLPAAAQAAVLLVVLAALLKCAQLPFHGWLIQVMEAPTPVSALLHAGVVNLGGFVLLRLAPLVTEVPAAQALLVVAGALTAAIAALVMTTRISIKVMLAWSTCAQMGFMLLQCGLGLWGMALLHLLAHSLYKAHAFLSSGGAVRRAQVADLAAPAAAPAVQPASLFGAAVLGGLCVLLAAALVSGVTALLTSSVSTGSLAAALPQPALLLMGAIVALALLPLAQGGAHRPLGRRVLAAFGVALAWMALHALVGHLPGLPADSTVSLALVLLAALVFAALFGLQALLALAPSSALAQRLFPWFYGGLFLDERVTRVALRLRPPPARQPRAAALPPVAARVKLPASLAQPSPSKHTPHAAQGAL